MTMISESEFAQLGDSLTAGFFIDNVILCLARTQRLGGHLQEGDRSTIQDAVAVMDHVLSGERWLTSKRFDANSGQSALAFDRAVRAMSLSIRDTAEFTDYIKGIQRLLTALLGNETVQDNDIQRARDFFSRYGRGVLIEGQGIIDRSVEPQGVRLSARLTEEPA